MADDEDIFAAFDETPDDYRKRKGIADGSAGNSSDPMAKLEASKRSEASSYAQDLLQKIVEGRADEEVVPEKRPRLENLDEADESGHVVSYAKRTHVHAIQTDSENCIHEVALPPDVEFEPLRVMTTDPAKTYPFQLDAFQKEAIQCIENNQSVLVSAHTSAGKTVVALYAIAQCLRDKQRVIYTSPIKALSNQKYRELEEEFGDVGLMTGDVTLNPEASCLVMTTEILRSMLYRGSEIMREVGWVVFDEIHYMRDKERGVVWEETIILLPDNVHHVFLSATIPNARQFAEWVCWLHSQPCHVVYTDYRPTPLQHFIYPAGGDGLYEVVNVKGEFREEKFQQAMSCLMTAGDNAKGGVQRGKKGGAKGTGGESNVVKIIRTVKERDMVPAIVFSFSRKDCEAYAMSLKEMDFNSEDDKKIVKEIYTNAVDLLSDEDRKLPQIDQILPLLLRGIGVHHSGLLPILKEVIEILFGEGLIKTLFATETFSMGLNMPARTVIFTTARKFDGKDFRMITSGEYIQMSGRAGRRGKDDRGLVIMMVDQQMTSDNARQVIKGATDPLNSQFRLTYNMVLNLLRVDGVNPEYMLERSFYQFQNNESIPKLEKQLADGKKELENMRIDREHELKGYFDMVKKVKELKGEIKKTVLQLKHLVPFLHVGRLFHIKAGARDFGWGPLINFHRKINPDNADEMVYVLEMLLRVAEECASDLSNMSRLRPPIEGEKASWEVVAMTIDCVYDVSAVRIKVPKNLKSPSERLMIERIINECKKRFNNLMPELHPINDMKISDKKLESNMEMVTKMEQRIKDHALPKHPEFTRLKAQYEKKEQLTLEVNAINADLKKAKSLLQMEELGQRKRVLRRLQYCDQNDIILQKGRVACEIAASDELMLTEMIVGNHFNSLGVDEIAALMSCFVFQENAPAPKLAEDLSGCLRIIQSTARDIAKKSVECKLELDEDEYVESFKPGLMEVVQKWAAGKSFGEIMDSTDIFEGSIIRCLRRLEEVLREMVGAAKSIGNTELEHKFEEARSKIKRDIVFAASLYL